MTEKRQGQLCRIWDDDPVKAIPVAREILYAAQDLNRAIKKGADLGIVVLAEPVPVGTDKSFGVSAVTIRASVAILEVAGT